MKIAFMKSADQLEQSIATAISSGRISSVGGDPTLALTSISRLITNLENIEPIGRVVTEFDLDLLERSPEKDLLLEPGDRIFVPERSSTVTVSGQVLSPTRFNFDQSLKLMITFSWLVVILKKQTKIGLLYLSKRMASRVRNWPNSPNLSQEPPCCSKRSNPFDWLVFLKFFFL